MAIFFKKYFAIVIILVFFLLPQFTLAEEADCIISGKYGSLVGGKCQTTKCCPGLECKMVPLVIPIGGAATVTNTVPLCVTPQSATAEVQSEEKSTETVFVPQISIPGSIQIGGKTFQIQQGQGINVDGDTFGSYMALFFRFFMAAIAVMAVVMIMWAGFKRIYAAGSPERISDSNDAIINAIIGLVLALVSYSLLQIINPRLVRFDTISAEPIKKEYLDWESDAQLFSQAEPKLEGIIASPNTLQLKSGVSSASEIVTAALDQAYQNLLLRGYGMYITSAYRDPKEQQSLIDKNCPDNATNSNQCKPPTCLLLGGPNSCAHTSGQAVDVWATTMSGSVCIKGILPNANMTMSGYCNTSEGRQKCLDNPCQKVLIEEMKKQGFCRLCNEPWHFEKPKMSPGCTC